MPLLFVWVQLKNEVAASFGEALQRKLLEVEGLYSQARSRYTFIQALVRRIRGLLRQQKNWSRNIFTRTGKDINTLNWMKVAAKREKKKQEMRHFLLWRFLSPSENCGKWCVLWPVPYYIKRCHAPMVSQRSGESNSTGWIFLLIWYCSLLITE